MSIKSFIPYNTFTEKQFATFLSTLQVLKSPDKEQFALTLKTNITDEEQRAILLEYLQSEE